MINDPVNLNIGGMDCCIITPNKSWSSFIKQAYRDFTTNKIINTYQLIFKISPSKRRKYFHLQAEFADSNTATLFCPDDMSLYRQIDFYFKKIFGYNLSKNNGFLLHASALQVDKRSFVFSGRVGAGKSTIHKLLPQFRVLADDAAIIKSVNNQYQVFGSPFFDTNKPDSDNIHIPISCIYFIKQATKNRIKKLPVKELVQKLLVNVYPCKFSYKMNKILLENLWKTCYHFSNEVPGYNLSFKKEPSFWQMIRKTL